MDPPAKLPRQFDELYELPGFIDDQAERQKQEQSGTKQKKPLVDKRKTAAEQTAFNQGKADWAQDQQTFLRAAKKLTFRVQAMKLMGSKRNEFFQEMDEQDRLLQERKGAFMLDAMKINPHRVQLFSINEIWQCISKRLIELRVMKDPECDSLASDSDSTEVEEDCDFVQVASERVHSLFKGKKKQDRSEKSVAELMRRNDLKLMKRVVTKVVEHE